MQRGHDPVPEEFEASITGAEAFGPSFEVVVARERLDIGTDIPDSDLRLELRRTLGMFATGVTVITVEADERVHGMTANAFMSVSLEPPLVLISVDRRARMNALLHEGARYGISVLAADQEPLSDRFAGRVAAGMLEARFEFARDTPLVEGAIAHLVAKVVRSYWGGDHSLFLGQVEYARYVPERRPLLFHGGRYEQLLLEAPVLSALPAEVLARMLEAGEERSYADGDAIVRDGELGTELYVVLAGSVRIERNGRLVRTLSAGDLFGEIAVLDGGTRSADVVAAEPARCLAVPREVVRLAIEAEPRAAWALLGVLARRLREA
ncbi:MAG: flavin reductase [Actinobacteria bacterium]|nr:flavin reductase [Actinomycetota bacterium]